MALTILSILAALNILLTVLTLQRIIGRPWVRKYYLLVLLLILNLLQVVPPMASFLDQGNWGLVSAQRLYWTLYLLFELAIYLFVFQMTYRVSAEVATNRWITRSLPIIACACLLLTGAMNEHRKLNNFMSFVIRDMTFLAVLMNLVLWRLLTRMPSKDFLLLTVCSGLGIQCTGDAIGHSIRHFDPRNYVLSDAVLSFCGTLAITIWYMGFTKGHRVARDARNDRRGTADINKAAAANNQQMIAPERNLSTHEGRIPSV